MPLDPLDPRLTSNPGTPAGKFAARTLLDLLTVERNVGRKARNARLIVTCEVDDGSWCELDADDLEHAKVLAHTWVDKLRARGCSVWAVEPTGVLVKGRAVYHYYWSPEAGEGVEA